jgi:hypothetical protein
MKEDEQVHEEKQLTKHMGVIRVKNILYVGSAGE